jgi:hypothetical protein
MTASDAVIIDQEYLDDSGTLAQLFVAADNAIERRRYQLRTSTAAKQRGVACCTADYIPFLLLSLSQN